MAGRGRGRGRGQLTFNIEAVGIGKGENLPPATLQPTPLFPPMEHKPIPLQTGEEAEYMLALKQELRGAMKNLPFYIRPAAPKKDVERYSDKYQSSEPTDNTIEWDPDWKRLPKELRIRVRKPAKDKAPVAPKCAKPPCVDKEEIIRKLEVRPGSRFDSKGPLCCPWLSAASMQLVCRVSRAPVDVLLYLAAEHLPGCEHNFFWRIASYQWINTSGSHPFLAPSGAHGLWLYTLE
ncbi:DNA-directed RNA polymerase III subunit RPC7-like isoform X1 [Scleropages formosus]|uniref:DNA-directed RNA polymerase III subunit RPC7-like n=1 Tax=Scleropages formosus TaxID=113540 RepID=A0A8C9T997_SCLFO|nr:DNA-directed RNA polymerase III subunit RPC7-like isoform X1 [Scleropages formosus]XP_018620274.1 DNA-directed RNA polymerase III subunit RPC7-like isoform X1 [Scleropages formosus]